MVQNLSCSICGDIGFATALVTLTISTCDKIIDINTGKPIISLETAPKIVVDRFGTITDIEEIPLNLDQIDFKCQNYTNIPVTAQLFVFKVTTIPGIADSGNFLVGIVIPTDFNDLSSIYIVIYDLNIQKIIFQAGQPSFTATFVPNFNKCDRFWIMDYTPPIIQINLGFLETVLQRIATAPPVITGITFIPGIGPIPARLLITGSNFLGATVTIPGTTFTVTTLSDVNITVTFNPNPTPSPDPYTVTITTPFGSTSTQFIVPV